MVDYVNAFREMEQRASTAVKQSLMPATDPRFGAEVDEFLISLNLPELLDIVDALVARINWLNTAIGQTRLPEVARVLQSLLADSLSTLARVREVLMEA